MKRTLIAGFGTAILVLSFSAPANASALLSLTNGATTVTCDNSQAFTATNCGAGFTTAANSNSISFSGTVGGYSVGNVNLNSNSPGSATLATTSDAKNFIQNISAGATTLTINFAENNFSLPAGSTLNLSASQSGTFSQATAGSNQNFTGFADGASNLLDVGGTASITPQCTNPAAAPPTQDCSTTGPVTQFARTSALFAMSGTEVIALNQGGIANFTANVDVTPTAEPASILLMSTGLIAAARALRRRKQQAL